MMRGPTLRRGRGPNRPLLVDVIVSWAVVAAIVAGALFLVTSIA